MKEHKAAFRNFIDEKGLKTTRQRNQILEFFLSSRRHLSVEEFHREIRERHPSIGYATVYRTLKLFAESGIAREIDFGDGQTRYEPLVAGEHHDHLVCLRCGAIEEFSHDGIESLQEEVALQHGFSIVTHRLEIYGHCKVCRDHDNGDHSPSQP
ncbi:MAG: transcriptional repressor [Desulfuromonadia bacterium]